jgi:Cof subfamily protein (haloacid dehalogenase superfamily)
MTPRPRYRLLAIDADGTLLDGRGAIRPSVRESVRRARRCGLQVVLCTGRRFRTALPLLEELELDGQVVIQNGVLVKEIRTGVTLHHSYLSRVLYRQVVALIRRVGPPLVYLDHHHENLDFVTECPERAHPYQQEYLSDNRTTSRVLESVDEPPSDALVMLSCMADAETLLGLREQIEAELGDRVRTNFLIHKNYRGHILETVSAASGKWPALRRLAESLGIAPEEIAAIGDDSNDVEMIAGAGLGIAMANAVEAARRVADRVTASNEEDGVARAVDELVLAPLTPR